MTDVTPKKGRAQTKAATRARILAAARSLFTLIPYNEATLRHICKEAGVTMGAVTNHFVDKAEIWRAAMNSEPPTDSTLTRAAAPMLAALKGLVALKADATVEVGQDERLAAAWKAAERAIAQAEGDMAGAIQARG